MIKSYSAQSDKKNRKNSPILLIDKCINFDRERASNKFRNSSKQRTKSSQPTYFGQIRNQKTMKNSSSLNFQERTKQIVNIYRNLSDYRKNYSKSLNNSHSPSPLSHLGLKNKNDIESKGAIDVNNRIMNKNEAKRNRKSIYGNSNNNNNYHLNKLNQSVHDKKLILNTPNNSTNKNWQNSTNNTSGNVEQYQMPEKIELCLKIFVNKIEECLKIKTEKLFMENYHAAFQKFQDLYSQLDRSQIEKQNKIVKNNILQDFVSNLKRGEEKRYGFKTKILYESIHKLEKQKDEQKLTLTELAKKKQSLELQIGEIKQKNYIISQQLKLIKDIQNNKVSNSTQTLNVEEKQIKKSQSPIMTQKKEIVGLIRQLRQYKKKQEQYIRVLSALEMSGINVKNLLRKFRKSPKQDKKSQKNRVTSLYKPGSSENSSQEQSLANQSQYLSKLNFTKNQRLNKCKNNKSDEVEQQEADQSIISSMDALSFNYIGKSIAGEEYTPRRIYKRQNPIPQHVQQQLNLNFSCLYTQDDQFFLDDAQIFDKNGCYRVSSNNHEGCPTI